VYEAAGVKRDGSRFSVISSGVDTKDVAALDCKAGTRGTNVVLVTKGSDSVA